MKAASKLLRPLILAGFLLGALAGTANAGCVNDDDCPGTACGTQVCDYSTGTPTCVAAGKGAKGEDGWGTKDANCKCKALGATCGGLYCPFTRPADAPGSGAGGTSGGAGTT